jgi:hypothetical protein
MYRSCYMLLLQMFRALLLLYLCLLPTQNTKE